MDFERFINDFNKGDNFGVKNKIRLVSLFRGSSHVEMDADESDFNYMGSLHGGAIFLISDIAAGTAVASYGENCVTLSSSINFVRPAKAGRIYAKATVEKKGKTVSVCNVHVYNEDGKIISMSKFTMFKNVENK